MILEWFIYNEVNDGIRDEDYVCEDTLKEGRKALFCIDIWNSLEKRFLTLCEAHSCVDDPDRIGANCVNGPCQQCYDKVIENCVLIFSGSFTTNVIRLYIMWIIHFDISNDLSKESIPPEIDRHRQYDPYQITTQPVIQALKLSPILLELRVFSSSRSTLTIRLILLA